ncbi:MAG TPA: hypothetical protein PLL10_02745 [Elusimicrobiales bacterium]|nr:hypothetical protein [Elusimicrobiales bacterium]
MKHLLFVMAATLAFSSVASAESKRGPADGAQKEDMPQMGMPFMRNPSPKAPAKQPGMKTTSSFTDMANIFKKATVPSPEIMAGSSVKVFTGSSCSSRDTNKLDEETVVFGRVKGSDRSVRMIIGKPWISKAEAEKLLQSKNSGVDVELSYTSNGYVGGEANVYEIEVRAMNPKTLVYRYIFLHSVSDMDGGPIYYGMMQPKATP